MMFDVYKLKLLRMVINYLLYTSWAGSSKEETLWSCWIPSSCRTSPWSWPEARSARSNFPTSQAKPETCRFRPSTFQAAAFSRWNRIRAKVAVGSPSASIQPAEQMPGSGVEQSRTGRLSGHQASKSCVQAGFEADPSQSQYIASQIRSEK